MKKFFISLALLAVAAQVQAAPVFMSSEWAQQACEAWNSKDDLTNGLSGNWINNNDGRGYKVIQIYRMDCPDSARVELTISAQDGQAKCTYGGPVKHTQLNSDVDYVMYGTDEDWVCMGEGKWGCGPMGAMMSGKLKFEGPKWEAMKVMGPFESFLLLTGEVETDRGSCP